MSVGESGKGLSICRAKADKEENVVYCSDTSWINAGDIKNSLRICGRKG